MHPILVPLKIGNMDFSLHTYGAMIALGFIVGLIVALREARRTGVNKYDVLDLVFWVALAGFVGARLLFIVVNAPQYWYACVDYEKFNVLFSPPFPLEGPRCFEVLNIFAGGLVWYGGLIGAILAAWLFTRRRKLNFFQIVDVLVPSVALGHGFGRMGCLFAGCCFGRPAGSGFPLAIQFPQGSMAWRHQHDLGIIDRLAESSAGVHPTQLYEAFGEVGIFFLLLFLARRKVFHGQLFLIYLGLYPVLRSIIEVFRGDSERGFIIPGILSVSQFISLLVVLAAGIMVVHLHRVHRRGGPGEGSGVTVAEGGGGGEVELAEDVGDEQAGGDG